MARIEEMEKRVESIKSQIAREGERAKEDIANRIASFQKFEKSFWEKEEVLSPQIACSD